MSSLMGNLVWHYLRDAWPFSVLHLSFLLFFLYRWRQAWHRVGTLLDDLKKNSSRSTLLEYAQKQISTYAKQGREPDLPRIERYITDRFQNAPESIRALVNTFIVIGLMGTLFSLFAMGQQPGSFTEPSAILGRMGIAFSASFFGIVWALICSVGLLGPLRRRTDYAVQEIHRKLTEISAEFPPDVPEKGLELVARTLRENVNAIGAVVDRLEQREEENRISSREILTRFSESTSSVINQLLKKVEDAQARTDQVTLSLRESITSSLTELKERFLEISESWRSEMQQTIAASENAATRLTESSNNLSESTKDVSTTLKSVRSALDRTKDLAKIVVAIEEVTKAYLGQTNDQINVFKTGLDVTLDAARAIPDEWYTMLTLVKDDLAKRFEDTAIGWKTHVEVTGDILASRTDTVSSGVTSLSQFFAPTAPLSQTLSELSDVLLQAKEWIAAEQERKARDMTGDWEPRERYGDTAYLGRNSAPRPVDAGGDSSSLEALVRVVESIHRRLDDFAIGAPQGFYSVPEPGAQMQASSGRSEKAEPKSDLAEAMGTQQTLDSEEAQRQTESLESFDDISEARNEISAEDPEESAENHEAEGILEQASGYHASSPLIFESYGDPTPPWWRRLLPRFFRERS